MLIFPKTWMAVIGLLALGTAEGWGVAPDETGHVQVQVLPHGMLPEGGLQPVIGQLADGRMIFATSHALLLHDGHHTEVVPLPCETSVAQVVGQPDGSVLVAGPILMAFARPTGSGGWTWEELREAPIDKHGGRANVWTSSYRALVRPGEVIAVGASNPNEAPIRAGVRRNGQWTLWRDLGDDNRNRYVLSETTAYEIRDGRHLRRWTDGGWISDRTLSEPIEYGIAHLMEREDSRLLIVDRSGLFRTIERDGTVQRGPAPDPDRPRVWIGAIRPLDQNGFVVTDDDGRLHVLRADGTRVTTIDSTTGLPSGTVWANGHPTPCNRRGNLAGCPEGTIASRCRRAMSMD